MPNRICKKDILLIIKTRPESLARRRELRKIYAGKNICGPFFIIGQSYIEINNTWEGELFDDLIVAEFPDRYDMLPTKTLASMQYALSGRVLVFLNRHWSILSNFD